MRDRRSGFILAVAALVLVAGATVATPTASAAGEKYVQSSLAATVSGTSVTASGNIRRYSNSSTVQIGICTWKGGVSQDFPGFSSLQITTTNKKVTRAGTFAAGTYSFSLCLMEAGGNWPDIAGPLGSFTVAGAPTSTTTTTTTTTTPPPADQPAGPSGAWSKVFADEFNGAALDTAKWSTLDGWVTNGVTVRTANVSVSGGTANLVLSNSSTGAEICTCQTTADFKVAVGQYAEARVYFPGTSTQLYNWPAWWVSGDNWPAAGENDIAEVLGGQLTVNYHSPSGSHNQGQVAGSWGNAFHTYGIHRKATSADVYWDGVLVRSYPTDDNGGGESLIVNVGKGSPAIYGAASIVKVDWVRVWSPA